MEALDQTKIDIGAGLVSFDGAELGRTTGEMKLAYSIETQDIATEEDGTVDEIVTNDSLIITVPLFYTDPNTLLKVIPWGHVVVDGAKLKLVVGKAIGTRLYQYAKIMTIHPLAQGDADVSKDVTVFKCFPKPGPLDLAYSRTGQRVANIQFVAIRDTTKAAGYDYFCIGDTSASADVTAPTVSSTTPAADAVGVAKASGLNIDFTMSEAISLPTVIKANTAIMANVAGTLFTTYTVSYVSAGNKIRLTTTGALDALTKYNVILNTGVEDLNGNHLAAPYILTFTTAA